MEHIIQFGVNVDDERIEQTIIQNAANACISEIRKATSQYTCGQYSTTKLDLLFQSEIKKIIDENKDKIIENATNVVVERLMKTKAITEAKLKIVAEVEES